MMTLASETQYVIDNFLFRFLVLYLLVGAFGGVFVYAFQHLEKAQQIPFKVLGYLWLALGITFAHVLNLGTTDRWLTWGIISAAEMLVGFFVVSMINWEKLTRQAT